MKKALFAGAMALACSVCFAQQSRTPNGASTEAPPECNPYESPANNGGASEGAGRAASADTYRRGILIGTITVIAVGAAAAFGGGGSDSTPNH